MCKYCNIVPKPEYAKKHYDWSDPLPDADEGFEFSIALSKNTGNLSIRSGYQLTCCAADDEGSASIDYCPMCGRKLKED